MPTMGPMQDCASIFPHSADFDPAGDFDAFLKSVPAKWVVYLLADEADRPVQLLCVKNLRNSLKRRLGSDELEVPSKRVNYRELVRRVYWVRVDSTFESDCTYLEAARLCFPVAYEKMIGFRPAWFLHVNPDSEFPRYVRNTDLSLKTGQLFGPIEDKVGASRLIEMLEDAFDLCRYYNILVQSPDGKACAYKEMGKCPAPCDGSISIEQYRRLIEWSVRAIVDPADLIREHTRRMQAAAAQMRFETAGKIKQYIDELGAMNRGPFRFVSPLADFAFVALQRARKDSYAAVFLILPGSIEQIATVLSPEGAAGELLTCILHRAEVRPTGPIDRAGQERVALVASHLFATKNSTGVFIRLSELDAKSLARSYRELLKQEVNEAEVEGEGIVKELQPGST